MESIPFKSTESSNKLLPIKTQGSFEDPQEATKPKPKEGRPNSKFKIYLFGITNIFAGFVIGFNVTQFATFFEYFMQGKFGDSIESVEYDGIQSILNSCTLIGLTLTSMFSSKIVQTQSPLFLTLVMQILLIIVTNLQIFMPLIGLYIVRTLLGMVTCFLYMLGPIMVNECLPSQFTSTIGTMFSISLAISIIASSSVSSDIARQYWYLFLNICSVYELIRFLILLLVVRYESPYYVFYKLNKTLEEEVNKKDKPMDTEDFKASLENKFTSDARIKKLVSDFYVKEDQESTKLYLFENIYNYMEEKKKMGGIFKLACSQKFRKQFLLACLFNFSNQFTGINIVLLYSKQIYIQLGFTNPDLLVFLPCKSNQPSSSCSPRSSSRSFPRASAASRSSA